MRSKPKREMSIALILCFLLMYPVISIAQIRQLSDALKPNRYAIVVYKSRGRVVVLKNRKSWGIFPIAALGFDPLGPKTRRGDGKTPEGKYCVVFKNEKSICDRSLELNYPNEEDAKRGLAHHLITAKEANEIIAAAKARVAPPQDTLLGGLIFIHGSDHCMRHPSATYGCIALHNADMEKLFDLVSVGTPVTIEP